MNGATHASELVVVAMAVFAALAGVLAWLVHTIRRGPHPEIHLWERLRRTVRRR